MESFIFGHSRQNLPILAHQFTPDSMTAGGSPKILILGGVHGDEPEGVVAALGLLDRWSVNYPLKLRITLVPAFNVDGVLAKQRTNGAGVDLNRNLPTKIRASEIATPRYHPGPSAGSEPENQRLMTFLAAEKPQFVLSLHSWKPLLNINGDCRKQAEAIASLTGYEITPTIGYSTPGCLGTYCGIERSIPTLTYEIERGLQPERILKEHGPAIIKGLQTMEMT